MKELNGDVMVPKSVPNSGLVAVHNQFIKEFSGSDKAELGKVVGDINRMVSELFIQNVDNASQFDQETRACQKIPSKLQKNAIKLREKYGKILLFQRGVGGERLSKNTLELCQFYKLHLEGEINMEELIQKIDSSNVSGPSKYAAKKFIQTLPKEDKVHISEAKQFKKDSDAIKLMYAELIQTKKIKVHVNHTNVTEVQNSGGAVNVAYELSKNSSNKVGVMIAANSGLPGGALGYRPNKITPEDLKISTQEESIWANAVLTACGEDPLLQENFHESTIQDKWGLGETGTMTKQELDFTIADKPTDYNGVFIVDNCLLSAVDENKKMIQNTEFPVLFVFADSVNANTNAGTSSGTMQRTLNKKASNDYDFFRACIKEKLSSALDGMANEGVTHPLIARLSCGIYAGKFKDRVNGDFKNILNEVLDENVGPKGEKRGCFFEEVIIPYL